MKNIEEIVREAGMSSRPEYYSGRGAISCDLNDKNLEGIYRGIKKNYGKKEADSYAQMVAKIPVLSATDFLLSLYKLTSHNWKLDKLKFGEEKGIYVDGDTDEQKYVVGMATIVETLCRDSKRDETAYIRSEFLRKHNIKNPDGENSYILGYYP